MGLVVKYLSYEMFVIRRNGEFKKDMSQQLKDNLRLSIKHYPAYSAVPAETIAEVEDLEKVGVICPTPRNGSIA